MKCEMRNRKTGIKSMKLPMVLLFGWLLIGHNALVSAQDEATPKQERVALKKAKKLRKKLVRGADFASLARRYSDDPGSRPTGGEFGWVRWGEFVSEFEEAVAQLKPGELSEPVRTPFGYHLIQLVDRTEDQFNPRHILIKTSSNSP